VGGRFLVVGELLGSCMSVICMSVRVMVMTRMPILNDARLLRFGVGGVRS
jgi:hypothetical protein